MGISRREIGSPTQRTSGFKNMLTNQFPAVIVTVTLYPGEDGALPQPSLILVEHHGHRLQLLLGEALPVHHHGAPGYLQGFYRSFNIWECPYYTSHTMAMYNVIALVYPPHLSGLQFHPNYCFTVESRVKLLSWWWGWQYRLCRLCVWIL